MLQDKRVDLMDHLRKYYGQQATEHLTLHSLIGSQVAALNSEAKARRQKMKEYEAIPVAFQERMEKFTNETAIDIVDNYIKSQSDIEDKIKELVFTEQVRVLMNHRLQLELPIRLKKCMFLLQNPESPWEKLLPVDVQKNIVSAAIWDYQKDYGQTEGFELVGRALKILDMLVYRDQVSRWHFS
ncbi:hypothetical protein E0Z10_g8832 [Xylaria hypoxylon]|uniref:Uncharacterized protein n=1 Tax=Xylaria hypoxylon TaxID=37992 RepID=A0A4Z0YKY8_9PEZI|nr:hypothetical protein E0Z10_g8832 [Xylaria hypoxylon]